MSVSPHPETVTFENFPVVEPSRRGGQLMYCLISGFFGSMVQNLVGFSSTISVHALNPASLPQSVKEAAVASPKRAAKQKMTSPLTMIHTFTSL